jgi:hypothetical protein
MVSEDMAAEFPTPMSSSARPRSSWRVTRDDWGPDFDKVKTDAGPARYVMQVKLRDGKTVEVRTASSLLEQYLNENMTPAQVEKITGAPAKAIDRPRRTDRRTPRRRSSPWAWGPTSSSTPTSRTARSSWSRR